jgi:hypothetical protein
MGDVFRFADRLGPEKIVHIHEPRAGLKAIVVIDNTAAGPEPRRAALPPPRRQQGDTGDGG